MGARVCPTCNKKASLKDIRVLYTKTVNIDNTVEITALKRKLEEVRINERYLLLSQQ